MRKSYPRPEGGTFPPVLAGVDLDVEPGTVCALLGSNGSGKTTLMRILSGLAVASAGEAVVAGVPVGDQPRLAGKIGFYTPGFMDFFPFLDLSENLRFFACLSGLGGRRASERVRAVIEDLDLQPYARGRWLACSSGIRQRFLLARALLHDPEVLFLDEPTAHLDPLAVRQFERLLREVLVGRLHKTVLMAIHQLEHAQQMADSIALLRDGRIAWARPAEPFRRGDANLLEAFLAEAGKA